MHNVMDTRYVTSIALLIAIRPCVSDGSWGIAIALLRFSAVGWIEPGAGIFNGASPVPLSCRGNFMLRSGPDGRSHITV